MAMFFRSSKSRLRRPSRNEAARRKRPSSRPDFELLEDRRLLALLATQALAIDAGGGAAGSFVADTDFSGGTSYSNTDPINTSGVTNPAPQAVYDSERYGNFTYTIPNLTPGANFTVRLDFAEIFWNAAGQRVFNVSINGSQVLNNFDIFAAAGGKDIAIVKQFTTTADSSGMITIQFTTVTNNAKISGIEINQYATTTTALTADHNPAVFGQPVTYTATVSVSSPGAGTPTGTVTFKDGATVLGTGTLSGGKAALTVPSTSLTALSVGTHSITASYGGDTNDAGSTSNTVSQVVNQDSTATTLTSLQNPSAFGQAVTFTATVGVNSPGAGTSTGTVTFEDGGVALPNGTVNLTTVGGRQEATYTTSALSVATHSITAVYNGDTSDAGSTSNTVSQVVNQDSTATTLSSDSNPSVFGQAVTFTATIAPAAPGTIVPNTGTVQFKIDNSLVGSPVTVSNGVATYTTSTLGLGAHTVSATYTDSAGNYNRSTGSL